MGALAIVLLASGCVAQNVQFDVRVSTPTFRGGPGTDEPTRLTVIDYSLYRLVMRAYDVPYFQIDGPELQRGGGRFNITADLPPDTTAEQLRSMLQNLLTERFGLKVHRETREISFYEMTVSRNGLKIKPHSESRAQSDNPSGPPVRDSRGNPFPPNSWLIEGVDGVMNGDFRAVNESMEDFVFSLASKISEPVIDATGLTGRYDFRLTWMSKRVKNKPGSELKPDPAIVAAVEELGLKLEPKHGPVEMLVIDHFEKVPTGN